MSKRELMAALFLVLAPVCVRSSNASSTVTLVILTNANAPAAAPPALPPFWIKFAPGQPMSPNKGVLSATGTYHINPIFGYKLKEVRLYALNPKGGKGGGAIGATAAGKWSARILDMDALTYDVVARMAVVNPKGDIRYFDSDIVSFNVK